MKHLKQIFLYLLVVFLIGISHVGYGQSIYEKYNIYRNPILVALNKISITGKIGYGRTKFSHTLSDVYFFQNNGHQYIFSNKTENPTYPIVAYTEWLNNPQEISIERQNEQVFLNTDTATLGFEEMLGVIPITLNFHYQYKDYRVGVGLSFERQSIKPLQPIGYTNEIRPYKPNFSRTTFSKKFLLLGYKFYRYWDYDFVAELQYGTINLGKNFNKNAMSRGGTFVNFGVSIEDNWSEYFRVILRPSFDYKSYVIRLPDQTTVKHRYSSFLLQLGLSINIPEIPRSPIKADHAQVKHVHTNTKTGKKMEVRGQPIWKKQNPKVGENHRRMWKKSKKSHKPPSDKNTRNPILRFYDKVIKNLFH